jgi:mxaK protein
MDLRLARMTLAAAVVLLGLAGGEAWRLVRIRHWNAEIANGGAAASAAAVPSKVRFAAAYAEDAKGNVQGALNAYRELDQVEDLQVRRDAKYNSATLYLKEALAAGAAADPSAALTLVELAKQSYRELLRENPDDWDARYNLERALRIAPDADPAGAELPPPPDHRHTPATTPGLTLGLP